MFATLTKIGLVLFIVTLIGVVSENCFEGDPVTALRVKVSGLSGEVSFSEEPRTIAQVRAQLERADRGTIQGFVERQNGTIQAIEFDGTLKSWELPEGEERKRLALKNKDREVFETLRTVFLSQTTKVPAGSTIVVWANP